MKILPLVLTVLLSFAGCTTNRPVAHSPQLTGAITKSEDISHTLDLAQSDNKTVKKAIGGIRLGSDEIKRLHVESMSSLDRLDYKATILLK